MSELTFVKTMTEAPPYIKRDDTGIPLVASEIGINTALTALAHAGDYQIEHGYDEKFGFWVKVTNEKSPKPLLDVSTFNCAWSYQQHYLFLCAIDAPDRNLWRVAISGTRY